MRLLLTKFNFIFVLIAIVFSFTHCKKDDDIVGEKLPYYCEGVSMVGLWQGVDTLVYDNEGTLDTIYEAYDMIFYENGIGKENGNEFGHYTYFRWGYQCNPDRLLFTFYRNQVDSLDSYDLSIFFLHENYEISENAEGKKYMTAMRPEVDQSITIINREIWRN